MPNFNVEISEVTARRLQAIAELEGSTLERVINERLEVAAADPKLRWKIIRKLGPEALPDLGWLDGYSGQTVDELLVYEQTDTPDSILFALEVAIQEKLDKGGRRNMTGVEWTILAVEALQREVNNGGFDQFFRNSSREHARMVTDCLVRIGCQQAAELTRKAVAVLGLERNWTVEDLDRVMEADDPVRDQILNDCDTQFYELCGISEALLNYAKKHIGGVLA